MARKPRSRRRARSGSRPWEDGTAAVVVDFRIPSPVTTEDSNYWDPLHYRVGIAERILAALAQARITGGDAADGFYRVLTRPAR